ncbi:STM4015 family protein [Haliscomenobacter hydrossis]|uniref:Wgr domain-containing protein n=1 Tax=Haliscomenobacter hydrossis (strain ATCC 27775 / DSM 1100 / LMG 10767 / O) TaxID=760192 RepID=F4KRM1_HALH1|nr:STM4015 family protein [Haliscomenobacter hydrossis]AEE49010.1 wgr domain-containing protein [Haliscomenobacter hydrossis DSM 1100]
MISENLNSFNGKSVIDFNPDEALKDLNHYVYRLRLDYEAIDSDQKMEDLIRSFAEVPANAECQELIIGQWDYDSSRKADGLVQTLVELKDAFKNLKALFIGDITAEEQEISWIQQSDLSPLLAAFPKLEFFQARGGDGLSLSELKHENLKTLILQTGGLPPNVVQEIANAHLPNLEKLEVWLGDDNYGFESNIEDFDAIINGGKFPKLTYLGLKNSNIQDDIAIAVAKSPLLKQLHTLDLSMGVLSDTGAQALLDSPNIKNLVFLNLDHHFMTDSMMAKIKDLGIAVSMEDQGNYDDEDDRYVEVSE